MKKTTRQILFSLYSLDEKKTTFFKSYEYLASLFPELSPGGLRSTMKKLCDDGWVQKTMTANRTFFQLTQAGKYQVLDLYPFLKLSKRKSGQPLHLIIATKPPSHDPQFLHLRTLLAKQHALKVTRGVYILLQSPEENLLNTLIKRYTTSVLMVEIKDIVLGELQYMDASIYSKIALKSALSGAGKEVNKLLDLYSPEKGLNNKVKEAFCSCFCQIEEIVRLHALHSVVHKDDFQAIRTLLTEWEEICQRYWVPTASL